MSAALQYAMLHPRLAESAGISGFVFRHEVSIHQVENSVQGSLGETQSLLECGKVLRLAVPVIFASFQMSPTVSEMPRKFYMQNFTTPNLLFIPHCFFS